MDSYVTAEILVQVDTHVYLRSLTTCFHDYWQQHADRVTSESLQQDISLLTRKNTCDKNPMRIYF